MESSHVKGAGESGYLWLLIIQFTEQICSKFVIYFVSFFSEMIIFGDLHYHVHDIIEYFQYNAILAEMKVKISISKPAYDMGLDARKPVFGGLRTTQAQTSLRIRAVCSAPLLFAFCKAPYPSLLQAKFHFTS